MMAFTAFSSLVYTFIILDYYNAPYFPFEQSKNGSVITSKYYFKSWARIVPYIMGLFVGI